MITFVASKRQNYILVVLYCWTLWCTYWCYVANTSLYHDI